MPKFAALTLSLACIVGAFSLSSGAAQAASSSGTPQYKVDASWPKELPNQWLMGQIGGMAVDAQDHIWVLNRPESLSKEEMSSAGNPPQAICCIAPPSMLVFDQAGNVIKSWGAPGFTPDWPKQEHAVFIDKSGFVWISGSGPGDGQILKFTQDGKQLLEIGHPVPANAPRNNQDTSALGRPAGIFVDDEAHEVFIADGYLNNRIMVYDSETGAFKRGWGAYGIPLDQIPNTEPPAYVPDASPASTRYGNPVHCITISHDGLVYVCDRTGDRVQIFDKQGKFLREFFFHKNTLGFGSAYTIGFSPDKAQKYLFLADGHDNVIGIFRRSDNTLLGEFGHKGRNAGQFISIHQLAVDSKGNIYTGEVNTGKRIQKFAIVTAKKK